jgi:hypothetical protein
VDHMIFHFADVSVLCFDQTLAYISEAYSLFRFVGFHEWYGLLLQISRSQEDNTSNSESLRKKVEDSEAALATNLGLERK